jgi:hypothetical protein
MGGLGRTEVLAVTGSKGDLPAVEAAQRQPESEAFGDEREVVGCGLLGHRAAFLLTA